MTAGFPFAVRGAPVFWLDDAIPVFAPRPEHERDRDPYDRDFSTVDLYTAFAFQPSAAPLYRAMADLFERSAEGATEVLDAGCGVGRFLFDCAPRFAQTRFAGLDRSYNMCRRARRILLGGAPIPLPVWARRGVRDFVFREARTLSNVWIAQGSVDRLPFEPMTFDVVTATLLLCRLPDPAMGLAELVRVLRPGGRLLLATPFGFNTEALWERYYPPAKLRAELEALGLRIDHWRERVRYREEIDAHGNAHEWQVSVIGARLAV